MGYRIRTQFQGVQGSPYLSTMEFGDTAPSQAGAQAASTAVGTFWGNVDARLTNALTWQTDPEVVFIDAATGLATASFTVTPSSGTGGFAAEPLPRMTQLVVRLRTGIFIAGRELKGRIFIPGYTESDNGSDALPLATEVARVQTEANALRIGASHAMVVRSRTHLTEAVVSNAVVIRKWAYLSSRRD